MREYNNLPKRITGKIIDFVDSKGFLHMYTDLGLYLTLAFDRRKKWDIQGSELVGKVLKISINGIDMENKLIYIGDLGEIKEKREGKYIMN